MTRLNIIGYGISFGAMFCALITSLFVLFTYGNYIEDVEIDNLIRNIILIDLTLAVIGMVLTRFASTDGK